MNFETKSIILYCVLFLKYWLQWRTIRKLFNLLTSLCILPYCSNYYFGNLTILIIIVVTWLSRTYSGHLTVLIILFCPLKILMIILSPDCHDNWPFWSCLWDHHLKNYLFFQSTKVNLISSWSARRDKGVFTVVRKIKILPL